MAEELERADLIRKNRAAWDGEPQIALSNSLDSSLKRNTAFIKKARMAITAENLPSLLTDIKSLSLEKYLSEVVSAVAEGLMKVKTASELSAAAVIVSTLHQRFAAQFTCVLAFQLVRGLAPPPASHLSSLSPEQREKDESSRVLRQRSLIKVVTELWLLGVFRTVQDALDGAGAEMKRKKIEDALPVFCLRELLSNDKDFVNLSIATTFTKAFPALLNASESGLNVPPEALEKLRDLFQKYYRGLCAHLQHQSDNLNRERYRLDDSQVAHGSSSAIRETMINELQKQHDRQVILAQTLTEALKMEPLVLRNSLEVPENDPGIIRGIGSSRPEGEHFSEDPIWDDEEQRRFYEILLDLSQVVPSDMLCEDTGPLKATRTAQGEPSDDTAASNAEDIMEEAFDHDELEEVELPEEEVELPSTTIGVKVHNLLLRLPEMTNRESIDNCAIEFSFLNSKASRNRLIRALLEVNIARTDLLPYYARLVATLNQYLTSIAESIINQLHRECRRLTIGKGLKKDIPKRIFNIRYISELVKFGIVPAHVSLHCLKIMLDNFTKFDVEVLACMLEHCGRYLLRSEATMVRMENVLTIVMRKARNISGVERTMIENAFYYVNPPEHAGIPQIERKPDELYIDKLLYVDLTAKSQDQILRLLKKLNWHDREIVQYLTVVFTSPWRLNYSQISLLGNTLSGLSKLHPDFMVSVVDAIVEDIRLGLEENIFRVNQMRVATFKYLGEMYNCRIVDSHLVLSMLHLCLSFGTPQGRPVVGGTAVDPAEDFFRVRLILIVLETCATPFAHGAVRGKVDLYLCFFQYYLKTKVDLPKDIEYDLRRILSVLRPALRLCKSLEEASSELAEAVSHSNKKNVITEQEPDEAESSISSDKSPDADEDSHEQIEGDVHDQSTSDNGEEEEEFVLLEKKREQDDLDRFAEEDLDREFSKLMSESLESRKQEVKRPLDIALPRRQILTNDANEVVEEDRLDNAGGTNDQAVRFTFLSRKSKPRSLALPSDSPLAINNAAARTAEQQEKQTIRELTLKYEGAQSREELEDGMAKAGVGVKFLPVMLAGQKGGVRSGSMFKMGARENRPAK